MKARRLLLGALALVLPACGGKGASLPSGPIAGGPAGVDAGAPPDGPNHSYPGRPDASSDPGGQPDASSAPDSPAPLSSAEQAETALGGPAHSDVVALSVSDMLRTYCGGCHLNGENGDGFAGGFDIGELIARGMIVPGSSAMSPLMQNVLHGTAMSPFSPRPTPGDVALLEQFIDRMRTEPPPSCAPLPFLGIDDAYALMLSDASARPEAERPFLRYLGLGYASNAGACGAALDEQRHALFKLVNAVSSASAIHVPAPIDAERRLYRLDVRDYGWDRALDLDDDGTVDYPDAWSAIVGVAAPFARELTGPEASALSSATGARVPLLPVNAFVNAASLHDLYYALVGMRANLGDAQLDRGIDLFVALEESSARRAGFERDSIDESLVTRAPLAAPSPGDYWLAEIQNEVRDDSVYNNPVSTGFGDWSKSIFRLPNGMMAFSANVAQGQRLGTMPRACVGSCVFPEKDISIACHGCHASGLLPMEDVIRDYVSLNPRDFDATTPARVEQIFPRAAEMAALIAADNARYLAALDQAGVPRDAPDPISRVYLQFSTDPIDLERAAAELGVTAAALRDRLGALPELSALADPTATIDRSTLASGSARALCALGTRNRPAACP